MHFLNIP